MQNIPLNFKQIYISVKPKRPKRSGGYLFYPDSLYFKNRPYETANSMGLIYSLKQSISTEKNIANKLGAIKQNT